MRTTLTVSCLIMWAAFAASTLQAGSFVWDGGSAAQDKWSFKQNWNPNDNAPPNDGTADLIFSGDVRLTPDSGGDWSINSITFGNLAGSFILSGGILTINGNAVTYAITNDDADTQTLNHSFVLGGSQTWNANLGSLLIGGAVNLAGYTLTITGAADTSVTGAISGTGAITKTGMGTLTLAGANTYSGGTTISSGTVTGDSTSIQGAILNNASLIFNQAATGTYAGAISGSGSFTKAGAGNLTLTGANTFTGATTVNDGTLTLGTAGALADTNAVTVAAPATLALAAGAETIGSFAGAGTIALGANVLTAGDASSTAFSGSITGTGSITKTGSGTLTLSGTSDATVGYTVSAGTLVGSSANIRGNVANSSALVFDQASNGSYAGLVSGTGTFTKTGAGTLTLTTNAGSPSSPTVAASTISVTAGGLTLAATNSLGDTSALAVGSGATVTLSGGNETVGLLSGAGTVALGTNTLTTGGAGDSAFSGTLTGTTATLAKTGSGTLTLTGTSDSTIGFSIASGGGTLVGSTANIGGNVANAGALVFNQASDGTYSGVVSGTGSFTKTGSGNLTVTAAQTYTGNTTLSAGTVTLGASERLADTTNLSLGNSTTLVLDGFTERVQDLSYSTSFLDFGSSPGTNYFLFRDGLTSTGTLTINNYSSADGDELAFTGSAAAGFVDGVYFYGIGGGTLITNETAQTLGAYGTGWKYIRPDTTAFRLWDGGAGVSDPNFSNRFNWNSNQALNDNSTLKLEFNDDGGSAGPVVDQSYNVNAIRFVAAADAFNITSSGGALTFDGVVPGIIQLSSNAQTLDVPLVLNTTTVIETTGSGDLTLSGAISGTGGLTKVGTDTAILSGSGANTYTGTTTIREGTLVAAKSTALGSTAGGTTVDTGATLELQNNITVGAEALSLGGTLLNASGTNTYQGAVSGAGVVNVTGGALTLGGTTANTYTDDTTVSGGTLTLAKSADVTAVSGNLTATAGTVSLSAAGQIADTSAVALSGSASLALNGHNETVGSLASASGSTTVSLGAGTLTTGGTNASTAFAGTVSGTGGLTKAGTGTFTLSGANTYTGTTTVSGGTLVATNSAALGTTAGGTTVDSGATLELQNNITVGAEALSLGGTLLNASGTNTYQGAVSGAGVVNVTGGALTLGGTTANTYTGDTTVSGGTLTLAKSADVTAVSGNLTATAGTVSLSAAGQIADTSAVALSGSATLALNGHNETVGSLASASGSATVSLGAGTLTTGGTNASTAFAGTVSGTGGLTKAGTGTFTLSGANTYTGTTTVSGGTLELGTSGVIADASAVSLGYSSTLSLTTGVTERVGIFSYNDAALDLSAAGATTFLFSNAGSQVGFLTVDHWTSGSDMFGYLASSGDLSQSFLDNIFFAGIGVGIGAERTDTTTNIGGQDYYSLRPITTFVWDGGQNTGTVADMDNWSKGNNWDPNNAPGLAAGKAIVMAGIVRTTNDMDGAYLINSLLFRSDAGAFTINSSTADTLSIKGGGIYNESTATQTLNVGINLQANQAWTAQAGDITATGPVALGSYNLTLTGDNDTTLSGAVAGTGGIIKVGTGTVTLSRATANTFTGATTITSGTAILNKTAGQDATGTGALAIGDGTGSAASATVRLNASNQINDAVAVTIATDGKLDLQANSDTIGALTMSGGTVTGTGTVTLGGDLTFNGTGTNTAAISANVGLGGNRTVQVGNNGSGADTDLTISGAVSGSGFALNKTGAGTLALTGTTANTFTGGLSVSDGLVLLSKTAGTAAIGGGTVTIGDGTGTADSAVLRLTAANQINDAAAIVVAADGLFDATNVADTVGSIAGSGNILLGTGQLIAGGNNTNTAFSGTLVGDSASLFEKAGTGTLTIDSNLGFAGTVDLTGGALAFNVDNAFGTVNISAGTTLRLSDTTLNITNLNLTGSGSITLDFAGSASLLNVTNLDIGAGITLNIINWQDAADYFFAANWAGAAYELKGTSPMNQVVFNPPTWSGDDTKWQIYDHQITPVPEPSTYGALLLGAMGALLGWRRWRQGKVAKAR